jgi:hypothetical protein
VVADHPAGFWSVPVTPDSYPRAGASKRPCSAAAGRGLGWRDRVRAVKSRTGTGSL